MYRWHKIQMLQKGGMKLKKIARTLGLSINTVRKYVRGQSPPEFQRSKCLSQLNPYVSQNSRNNLAASVLPNSWMCFSNSSSKTSERRL